MQRFTISIGSCHVHLVLPNSFSHPIMGITLSFFLCCAGHDHLTLLNISVPFFSLLPRTTTLASVLFRSHFLSHWFILLATILRPINPVTVLPRYISNSFALLLPSLLLCHSHVTASRHDCAASCLPAASSSHVIVLEPSFPGATAICCCTSEQLSTSTFVLAVFCHLGLLRSSICATTGLVPFLVH